MPEVGHERSSPTSALKCPGGRKGVQWTSHSTALQPHHVGVDHGGGHVRMAQQLLDGANVAAVPQQIRRCVAKQCRSVCGVACFAMSASPTARLPVCPFESPLEGLVAQVIPPHDTAARIGRMMILRKQPEPAPAATGTRLLPLQRIGHLDACPAVCNIPASDLPARGQLGPQTRHQRCRQHHHAVLAHPAARWHAARNRYP